MHIQPSFVCIGGKHVPHFAKEALAKTLDTYVETIRKTASILAIINPILLVGLPLDEKFGLNPPVSGFFNEAQAERLFHLVPNEAQQFFDKLVKTDKEVLVVVEWCKQLPDLTPDDLEAQARAFDKQFKNHA